MCRKILVVDDDATTAEFVAKALNENGYVVDRATTGVDGLFHALDSDYATIVLDRQLPTMDGLAVLAATRAAGVETPVIFVSGLASPSDRVTGLNAGADDYLSKPFVVSELLARIEAIQRRGAPSAAAVVTKLTCGDLVMDLLAHRVERARTRVDLQPREYRLLEFLLRNQGKVVTRTMMLEEVWEYHFDPGTNVIDVHMSRLRRKIEAAGDVPILHTVRGIGYILREPAETLELEAQAA
jgi:two-component system OmpR family response regulator